MEMFQKWLRGLEEMTHLPPTTPQADGRIQLNVDESYSVEIIPVGIQNIRFQSAWPLPEAEDWNESDWETLLAAQVGIFAESKAILGWNSGNKHLTFHQTLSFESYDASELYHQLENFINQVEFWHGLTDKKGTILPANDYLRP